MGPKTVILTVVSFKNYFEFGESKYIDVIKTPITLHITHESLRVLIVNRKPKILNELVL